MSFAEPISETIWDIKYRYRFHEKIMDKTLQETWLRIAKAVAKAERKENQKHWQQNFYDILTDFLFLPGGRIIAGAGTKHHVTLFNCFVMPIAEDSLPAIFDALKEGALTLQQGGGIGYDFSLLRPEGALVEKIDAEASGPVSFMKIWNAMCATMLSTGARRGAMMGILRCDHPDIEKFIAAKSDPHELRHFNVSVLVTDKFMQAVKNNSEWELKFKDVRRSINARALWQHIMRSAYDTAEPGVLFEDTINRMNNLYYCETITATNPCGEIPLPSYGACNLGAINLTQFVLHAFTHEATIDWRKLETVTMIAARFLDNVIDISKYPLKQQKLQAHATRRIGLGITGLADMFVMLGLRYGSAESLAIASRVMKVISETTWKVSIELGHERGSFLLYEKDKYVRGEFVATLPREIQSDMHKYGLRNSHHNTIAPTGTISLLANNVSNGLEPIFSSSYHRTVRLADGSLKKFSVKDYALRLWEDKYQASSLPESWVDAQNLMPQDHLAIQHALQPYIDNAISKTINIPRDFPFEKLTDVYTQAYEYHLKGCTIFRPNAITGSVLEASMPDEEVDRCCKI